MSDITREELELLQNKVGALEKKVSELEVEVASLKSGKAINIQLSHINPNNIQMDEAHKRLRDSQKLHMTGQAQKVIGYDANKVAHKHIKVTYIVNGINYVGFTVNDMADSEWNVYSKPGVMEVYFSENEPEYAHAMINGKYIDFVGHVNNGGIWKKQYDANKKLYYFDTPDSIEKPLANTSEAAVQMNSPADGISMNAALEANQTVNSNHNQPQKQSLEKVIGTKWMGIFASILIFVAFVMFGASIYKMLSDGIKAAILLIISAGFTVVGLTRVNKPEKSNVLWHIVAGCGLGGFYITFLLMNMAFSLISEIPLLILLLIWTVGMIVISKRFSIVFAYVCYAGILISTILCNTKWENSVIGLVFYVITVIALIATNYESEYKKNYFWSLQFPLVFLYFDSQYDQTFVLVALWLMLLLTTLIQAHVFEIDENRDPDVVIYQVNNVLAIICSALIGIKLKNQVIGADTLPSILCLVATLAILINNYIKYRDDKKLYIVIYYLSCVLVPFYSFGTVYDTYIGMAIFLLPMLVVGLLYEKKHILFTSLVYLPIYLFINPNDTNPVVTYIIALVCIGFMMAMQFVKYSALIKYYLLAFITFSTFWMSFDREWFNGGLVYIILAIIAIVINTSLFINEEEGAINKIIAFVYNVVLMVNGLIMLNTYEEPVMFSGESLYGTENIYIIIIAMFVIALFVINLNFKKLEMIGSTETISGWLISIGYTLLLLSILDRLDAINFVVSICLIVTAILFITLGFKLDVKSMRLYGLAISIICVIKLVFFDIQYDSSAWYPVGLFVCGGLCLLICWIYNRIEKSNQKENV